MTYTVVLRIALRHINITMSAFVFVETANNKRYSTLLKICVWIVFKYRNVLTGCESEAPFTAIHNVQFFQVQEIVLRKMCFTHSNI